MTSTKRNPNKSEYDDLDEICSASTENSQQNSHCHFRDKPQKFLSDTAIHLTPEKIRAIKLEEQTLDRKAITGSIPVFFHLATGLPVVFRKKQIDAVKTPCENLKLSRKYTLRLICYVFLYALFLVAGAFCFEFIESSEALKIQTKFDELRTIFFKKYPDIDEDDLDKIIKVVTQATGAGVRISTNATQAGALSWRFGDYLLFTTSMVTTIGYGHLTPISNAGKIFCLIYAAIGIPLTLVLTTTMVEHLFKHSNKLLMALTKRLGHAYEVFSIQILHLSILAFTFLVLFLITPGVVFSEIEPEWSILDGFYFAFTSLTTIGLGDLVPDANDSKSYDSLYKIFTVIYLICGLIALMLVVSVYYTIPQLYIGAWLIERCPSEEEKKTLFHKNSLLKCHEDHMHIPKTKIESTTSSSKTLRTII